MERNPVAGRQRVIRHSWLTIGTLGVFAVLVGISTTGTGQVKLPQTKESDPPVLKLPPVEESGLEPLPEHPGVEARIRQAIDEGSETPAQTGDAVLDGILNTLQRRGSVLRGTALDEANDEPVVPSNQLDTAQDSFVGSGLGGSDYHLAEQLLKSARLLSKHPRLDGERKALVQAMRDAATRLLNEIPSSHR